ncbi:MAG: hypothetical protein K1X94_32820, partial [Sandaracinaceae bacterium]|nr:hypothetical protein [Sandaracinaceae bacterium]
LGETMSSLDKAGIKPRRVAATAELVAAARRVQAAYELPREVFALIGLDLGRAGAASTSEDEEDGT